MPRERFSPSVLLLAAPTLLAAPAAFGAVIQADTQWTLGGASTPSMDTDGPAGSGYVDVLGSDTDTPGNSIFYHTYGNTSGIFGSRVSGGGTYDIDGEFSYSGNFVAAGGAASFSFQIIPGQLDARQFYGTSPGDMPVGEEVRSKYEIDIRLDGATVWGSMGEVWVDSTGTSSSFSGSSIGGTLTVDPNDTGINYSWSTFTDTVALGTFAPGDTFLLEYDLRTFSNANTDPTACSGEGGTGGDPGTPDQPAEPGRIGDGCGTGIAQSGDPFDINNGSLLSMSGAVPAVPAPATLGLFAAGLAAIGALRQRRRD